MTRVIITNARTGLRLLDVPVKAVSWDCSLNDLDDISVTVTLNDPDIAKLNLRSAGAPGMATVAVIEAFNGIDVFMAGGFIWSHEWDEDSNRLQMSAAGWGSYFNRRVVLPTNANNPDPIILTADLAEPVFDEDEPREKGDSNPAVDTRYEGYDKGTIYKKLVQRMLAHEGSPEFFRFQADRAGDAEETILGAELKNGWDALTQLADREPAIDVIWETRWNAAKDGIEVLVRTGTVTKPRLYTSPLEGTPVVARWDKTVPHPAVTGLRVKVSADEKMGSRAWVSGGRQAASAIIVEAINTRLMSEGYPLLESVESHPTATREKTLTAYAKTRVRVGSAPAEWWSFEVRKDMAPFADQYHVGDYVELKQAPGGYVPEGWHRRRIVAMSGGLGSKFSVVTAEVRSDD